MVASSEPGPRHSESPFNGSVARHDQRAGLAGPEGSYRLKPTVLVVPPLHDRSRLRLSTVSGNRFWPSSC